MSIKVVCQNGHTFHAMVSLAGRQTPCPVCRSLVSVPSDKGVDIFDFATTTTVENASPAAQSPVGTNQAGYAGQQFATPSSKNKSLFWPILIVFTTVFTLFVMGFVALGVIFLALGGIGKDLSENVLQKSIGPQPVAPQAEYQARHESQPIQGEHAYVWKGADPWDGPEDRRIEPLTDPVSVDGLGKIAENRNLRELGGFADRNVRSEVGKSRIAIPSPSDTKSKTELSQANKGSNLLEIDLPALPWRAAYAPDSGSLLLSSDDHGFLVYSLNSFSGTEISPVRRYDVKGLPSAACYKPGATRNQFVFTGSSDDVLYVVDSATGEAISKVQLTQGSSIVSLVSSSNPNDPFVYVLSLVKNANNDNPVGMLGRINLSTAEQSYVTQFQCYSIAVTPDGERLAVASTKGFQIADWECLSLVEKGDFGFSDPTGRHVVIENFSGGSDTFFIGGRVSNGRFFADTASGNLVNIASFNALAGFSELPIVVGIDPQKKICFASKLDLTIRESIDVPNLESGNSPSVTGEMRAVLRTRYLPGKDVSHTFCDDKRGVALVIGDKKLLVARIDKDLWANEPIGSAVLAEVPREVIPGVPLALPIKLQAGEVEVIRTFYRNLDMGDPKRQLALIDLDKLKQPMVVLDREIKSEDTEIVVRGDVGTIANAGWVRIDNELMEVVAIDGSRLNVRRERPVLHQGGGYVYPVDKDGRTREVDILQDVANNGSEQLCLMASITAAQNKIFVQSLTFFETRRLPIRIRVDDEVMAVVAVDDRDDSLVVERNDRSGHSVSAQVEVLDGSSGAGDEKDDHTPRIENGILKWTPSIEQLGPRTLRLRVTESGISREVGYRFNVAYPSMGVAGFEIQAIRPDTAGNNLAVVWGQTTTGIPPELPRLAEAIPQTFIGVFDLERKELIRHRILVNRVSNAAMHEGFIYAVLGGRVHREFGEDERFSYNGSSLVCFDASALEAREFAPINGDASLVRVIAGKYIGVRSTNNVNYCFEIGALKPVHGPDYTTRVPTFGKIGENWVWDGVLYDKQFEKPQLLITAHSYLPYHANVVSESLFFVGSGSRGVHYIRPTTSGFASGGCLSAGYSDLSKEKGFVVSETLPVFMIPTNTGLAFAKSNTFDLPSSAQAGQSTSYPLHIFPKDAPHGGSIPDSITVHENKVFVCRNGRVVEFADSVFHDQLRHSNDLKLEHRQERFTLELDQEYTVKYSAEGATKYTMYLYVDPRSSSYIDQLNSPQAYEARGVTKLESNDGFFRISAPRSAIVERAMTFVASTFPADESEVAAEKYVSLCREAFETLTGRALLTVPVPYYAVVIAESNDASVGKAYMSHVYLVEVPQKEFKSSRR